jgi:tRNA-dihydrouridine synthase C
MVCDPGLALAVAADARGAAPAGLPWQRVQPLLEAFWERVQVQIEPRARAGRLKQWLNLLRRRHPQAEALYQAVRTVDDSRAVTRLLLTASWREAA